MNLDELEDQVLGHTRREMAPTREEAWRAREALAARLGAATLGKMATASASRSGLASLASLKTALLIVAAITGGGAVVGLSVRADDAASVAPIARPPEPVPVPNPQPQARPSPEQERTRSTPAIASHAIPSVKRSAPKPSAEAGEAPNRLAEEVRLLKRADQALRQGRPDIARNLLDELSIRYPKGQLLEERAATETLLACQRRRDEAARAAAGRFLTAHPASVYATRIRATCIDFTDGE